jgi:peptide-methionine (S)-S-oxide reductase
VQAYVTKLSQRAAFPRPIVTEIAPLQVFYPAEDYHQGYLARHPDQPYIVINDAPKLEHLRKAYPALYQEAPSAQ